MIYLRWEEGCQPIYKTEYSAGADVVARNAVVVPTHKTVVIPTGVYIDQDQTILNPHTLFEIQLRLRSSFGKKLIIPNGVGTIDLDFPGEIGLLVHNPLDIDFHILQYQRIGQLILTPISVFANLESSDNKNVRIGGFGSTDI